MSTRAKMSELRRGFVYLARLDKLRPVLVVSPDVRNALASDVILGLLPCTTTLSIAPTHRRRDFVRKERLGAGEPASARAVVILATEDQTANRALALAS